MRLHENCGKNKYLKDKNQKQTR